MIVLAKKLNMDSLIDVQETEEDAALLGHMMVTAAKVARNINLEGYRIVNNNGKNAYQTIHNLYLHVIGGQQLKWPPNNKPASQEQEESKNPIQTQINPQNA